VPVSTTPKIRGLTPYFALSITSVGCGLCKCHSGLTPYFTKWKEMAVAARRNFQRSGVLALECQINPQEFFAWCALNNQENNATSRGEFVSDKLSAAHESGA
jgi:hypothetical protein